MKTDDDSDFNEAKAEFFEAISHPARIKILQALDEKPMGFAELGRAVGIEGGGHLSFHMRKLSALVKMTPEGKYALTGDGKEALWAANTLRKSSSITEGDTSKISVRRRNWSKTILAGFFIALIIIGGISVYEQQQIGFQQQLVQNQQQQIAALQGQIGSLSNRLRIAQGPTLILGQMDFTSNFPSTTAGGFHAPTAVVFDSRGNLWISDYYNNRVLEFKPPFSGGMNASLVIGQASYTTSGAGGMTSASTLDAPVDITFDSSGNLWVVDSNNNRIEEFTPPFTTGMAATLVIGQKNFMSPSAGTSENSLGNPNGIAFDSSGDLWILDGGNNRVLEFKPPFTSGMNASLVIGQPNFQSSNAALSQNGLSSLYGDIAFDRAGDLWVGDAQNNRILEFMPPFSNGMNASGVIGQPNFNSNGLVINYSNPNPGGLFAPNHDCPWGVYASLSLDSAGNLWAAINCNLFEFKAPLISGMQPSVDIAQTTIGGQSGLFGPGRIGFDSSGDLWVPQITDNRVLEFSSN